MKIVPTIQQHDHMQALAAIFNTNFQTMVDRCIAMGLLQEAGSKIPSDLQFDPQPILSDFFKRILDCGITQFLDPSTIGAHLEFELKVRRNMQQLLGELEPPDPEQPSAEF